jgi:hypothetical protein
MLLRELKEEINNMKYRITIDEVIETEGKTYPSHNEIYQQVVEDLIVTNLVTIINTQNKHE